MGLGVMQKKERHDVELLQNHRLLSRSNFLLHNHFTVVVKFTFKPVSAVCFVNLSSSWASCQTRCFRFVVRSALISAGARMSAFWMCHGGI
jgi:hypothetical protein